MSEAFKFKIELDDKAKRIVSNLQTLPPKVLAGVARGMDTANQLALAKIKPRLVGVGPFPPEEHKLGRRSGSLYSGVYASPAEVQGQTVVTAIGTPVTNNGFSYAALHEFGGRVKRKGRQHTVRLKTDARGNLVRQAGRAHLAVFARAGAKRAVARTSQSQDHEYDMPARAPFRTGIGEALPAYKRNVSREIAAVWGKLDN